MILELNENQAKQLIKVMGIADTIFDTIEDNSIIEIKDYVITEIGKNFEDLVYYDEKENKFYENDDTLTEIDEIITEYNDFIIEDYGDSYHSFNKLTNELYDDDYSEKETDDLEEDYKVNKDEEEDYEEESDKNDELTFEEEFYITLAGLLVWRDLTNGRFDIPVDDLVANKEKEKEYKKLLKFYLDELEENGIANLYINK